jgi:hypothetical protein
MKRFCHRSKIRSHAARHRRRDRERHLCFCLAQPEQLRARSRGSKHADRSIRVPACAARILDCEDHRAHDFEPGYVCFKNLFPAGADCFTQRKHGRNDWRCRLSAENETVIEVMRMRSRAVDQRRL